MYKKYFEKLSDIKVPEKLVEETVMMTRDKNEAKGLSDETRRSGHSFRYFGTAALAACLAGVFMLTVFFGADKSSWQGEKKENSFIITANAMEAQNLGVDVSDTVIGAYAGESAGSWAMYENFEKTSEEAPAYFQSYCLNSFNIEGEGIESVTFRANAKGTYFTISPDGYYSSDTLPQTSQAERFTDMSLSNSAYSAEELTRHQDGLSYGEIYCDTFTYHNKDDRDFINLCNKLEFVVEGDSKYPEQAACLKKLWLYEEEIISEKAEGIPSGEKLGNLYLELAEASDELQELVLKDATVDVVVNFSDGSSETKTLLMGLLSGENGKWLTISMK